MLRDHPAAVVSRVVARAFRNAFQTRLGRYRHWPDQSRLIDEPLSQAQERADRLRRIYHNATRDAWDGPAVFRDAMENHGSIQLSREKRVALAQTITDLMWGELAAWIVASELSERLDEPDAKMAAASQVFDEARHFYVLRDYLAALHVPVPRLDPYFGVAARRRLATRDLTVKLFAMQILAEGLAVVIFRFLTDARVEPVLTEILPYFEGDEARHVGLGIMVRPRRLETLSRRKLLRIRNTTYGIGDLLGAAQLRRLEHYRLLGAEPRELMRAGDKMLFELSPKIGPIPGTDLWFFPTNPVTDSGYDRKLDVVLPRDGAAPTLGARAAKAVVSFGARVF